MHIKKEIRAVGTLALVCVILLIIAAFSKESPSNCKLSPSSTNCCKAIPQKTVTTSPWDFITQGILHFSA